MKRNLIITIVTVFLTLFGVVMVASSSSVWAAYKFNNPNKYMIHQLIFASIGFALMYICSKTDYRLYKHHANKILICSFILLILVLIPGIGIVRNGSRSWFGIGPFGIQPSEIAKLAMIIFVSKYLSKFDSYMDNIKEYSIPILLLVVVCFLLILLEPDFGSGAILVLSLIALIFTSKIKISFFVKLGFLGVFGVVMLIIAAPYRVARILAYLNPWSDPLGSGFQIIQSLYAIGPGGLFGLGLGNSIQKHFYLPEPQTDFIFSIISEEFGFMGVVIVVSLFLIIIIRGFRIARNTNDKFSKYLAFGIIFELAFQAILNLMVVVGLIPVTGVTLPFLSYGGSSLLITLCGMGIVLNISRYQR